MKIVRALAVLSLSLLLVGCAGLSSRQQRAITGGALGAGGGAAIGALSGGDPLTGAVIGGAAGAIGGALLGDDDNHPKKRRWR